MVLMNDDAIASKNETKVVMLPENQENPTGLIEQPAKVLRIVKDA